MAKARIQEIDDKNMREDLAKGRVVVVAGFQGVNENGDITNARAWRIGYHRRCIGGGIGCR